MRNGEVQSGPGSEVETAPGHHLYNYTCLYDHCLLGTDWPDMMICPGPGTGDCPEYSQIMHKLYKYTVNNKHHEYLSPTGGVGKSCAMVAARQTTN